MGRVFKLNNTDKELGESKGLRGLFDQKLLSKHFTWFDTGNKKHWSMLRENILKKN